MPARFVQHRPPGDCGNGPTPEQRGYYLQPYGNQDLYNPDCLALIFSAQPLSTCEMVDLANTVSTRAASLAASRATQIALLYTGLSIGFGVLFTKQLDDFLIGKLMAVISDDGHLDYALYVATHPEQISVIVFAATILILAGFAKGIAEIVADVGYYADLGGEVSTLNDADRQALKFKLDEASSKVVLYYFWKKGRVEYKARFWWGALIVLLVGLFTR